MSPTPAALDRGAAQRRRWRDLVVLAFVVIAVILGGSSRGAALATLVMQLAAVVALIAIVLARDDRTLDSRLPLALSFIALLVVTMIVQLVPLPATIWRTLPGREIAVAMRDLLGVGDRAFPFSLDPDATRRTAFALLPPIAAFLGVAVAGAGARLRLIGVVALIAVADLLLSTVQFTARGGMTLTPYDTLHAASAVGIFANRNHNADLFLIAPLLAGVLIRIDPRGWFRPIRQPAMILALVVFLLGVLIASSRTGLMLSVVTIAAMLLMMASAPGDARRGTGVRFAPIAAVVGVLVVGGAIITQYNPVARRILDRFANLDDQRFQFWQDSVYAAGKLWPFGSGSGTFDPVFRSVERLNSVGEFYINHAHNDYLETVIELGAWGAALIAMFLILLAIRTWPHFVHRRGKPLDAVPLAATAGIVILLLHSLVDYSLRTTTLATLFGMLCGLLFHPASSPRVSALLAGPRAQGGSDG